MPEFTAECDAIGVLRLLDAIRETGIRTRFYQASTSELYGKAEEIPQSETTPFHPRSPYAVAKLYGFWITRNYREAYGLHASNGILFNHESPRRGETFVTRKITMAVARIHRGMQECLFMGNIDARRDWGYAPDFVRMMWKMLQQEEPGDYVVATGETHSVREFIEKSFAHVGRRIECERLRRGGDRRRHGPPAEPSCGSIRAISVRRKWDHLIGNPAKAREKLGWHPEVTFEELVRIMTEGDLRLLDRPGTNRILTRPPPLFRHSRKGTFPQRKSAKIPAGKL